MACLGGGLCFPSAFTSQVHEYSYYELSFVAHLAAMEGQLSCLKFIVSESLSVSQSLGARNNNGETPKMLAERFYKHDMTEYISNIEWERDHPEEAESMLFYDLC